ncbi:hypothetical protein BAOM_1116 [Peribacillus asahii]|uniref:Replication protein n=1 Tax=Peribacillus asahii TaxID=228899 RepID=A0A3T0KN12_9BACI|nr:hypothetical protein [Peribacillus asahii]AZV41727.1 hypothetical protein BAOM_1116 [Peribacillus asahii]
MMKNLVNEKKMVILYPRLAAKIGVNQAIMLQHIHYWLKESKHDRDGRPWVYNTYQSWQEQLPFWSVETIKRIIRSLEKDGYLLSANYNRLKIDKTKWYTINYKKVAELQAIETPSKGQDDPSTHTAYPAGEATFAQAIPESTSNNPTKNTSKTEIHHHPPNEEPASLTKTTDTSKTDEIDSIIRDVFPYELKQDRKESIHTVYQSYCEELSLPAYKRVLKNISEHAARITRFEKYLEQAVKNELSPAPMTTKESPLPKKTASKEIVPHWLKEDYVDPYQNLSPVPEEERGPRYFELMKLINSSSGKESNCS